MGFRILILNDIQASQIVYIFRTVVDCFQKYLFLNGNVFMQLFNEHFFIPNV